MIQLANICLNLSQGVTIESPRRQLSTITFGILETSPTQLLLSSALGARHWFPKKDFICVVNETPTDYHGDPYFNRTWVYSNVAYGLLILVIERLSGSTFAQFVQERILNPLGMHDTALFESQLNNLANIVYSYA